MDYPELNQSLEAEIAGLEEKIEKVRLEIDAILEGLGELEVAAGDKREAYRNFLNSKNAKTKPNLGEAKKKQVENASKRVESKEAQIKDLEAEMARLEADQAGLEKEVEELSHFTPVSEQAKNPELLANFEFSKNAHRKPNSVFKIFEGRFTPAIWVMPKADGAYATEPWDRIPLSHCVVDPSLIPEWLIKEFDLVEWRDGLTEVEELELKKKAIPRLRDLFKHVKPLRIHSEKGRLTPNYRFMGIVGFDKESDGKMIYSRSRGEDEESVDGKMIQVHDSAYSALRMTSHAKHGHQAETALLSASELKIESLQAQLASIRKDDVDYEERKEEIREELRNEAVKLKRSTNYYKKSALRTMLSKVDFIDAKGRENLGATCATWLKAIRQLKQRKPQISNKSAYGNQDRQTLELLVSESEALLGLHFSEWNAVSARLRGMGSAAVFNGSPEEKLEKQKENLSGALFSKIYTLKTIEMVQPVRPFMQYSQLLKGQMEKVKAAIMNRDQAGAIAESEKVVALSAVFRAQKGVEEVIRILSLNQTPDLDVVAGKVDLVMEGISLDGNFKPGTPLSTFKGMVQRILGEFKKDLEEVRKTYQRGADLEEPLEKLKERLKCLDFGFWLGSIG